MVIMDVLLSIGGIAALWAAAGLRVVRQYERGVTFFLGRFWGTKGPGLIFLPAGFASQKRVSLRIAATAALRLPGSGIPTGGWEFRSTAASSLQARIQVTPLRRAVNH